MNHDGGWKERQWRRIEEEYDEPARDVVAVFHHEMRQPLCLVAKILYVSETTLRRWCREWRLTTRRSGYSKAGTSGKVLRRARALGFESVAQAIAHLRAMGKRWADIQADLGCSASTVSRNFTENLKGEYCLSAEGLRTKQVVRRRLNAEGRRGDWGKI